MSNYSNIFKPILLLGVFMLSFAVFVLIGVGYAPKRERVPIVHNIPSDFPVLVITKIGQDYHARVVAKFELNDYIAGLDNHSYLVPLSDMGKIKKEQSDSTDRFEVKSLPNGKQSLKVTQHWRGETIPHVNTGWYICESKKYTPKFFLADTTNEGRALAIAPVALMANVVVWFIIPAMCRFFQRIKRTINKRI